MGWAAGTRALMVLLTIVLNGGSEPVAEQVLEESSATTVMTGGIPDWFQQGSRSSGKSDFICVSTAGQATQALAEQELLNQLTEKIDEQIALWTDQPVDSHAELTGWFIREKLIVGDHFVVMSYEDDLTREAALVEGRSPTPYYRGFAEVELTPKFRALVEQWRRQPALRETLVLLGISAISVLGTLSILFGYLRLEQITHSHYTRRLQMVALAAVAVLAAGLYLMVSAL